MILRKEGDVHKYFFTKTMGPMLFHDAIMFVTDRQKILQRKTNTTKAFDC